MRQVSETRFNRLLANGLPSYEQPMLITFSEKKENVAKVNLAIGGKAIYLHVFYGQPKTKTRDENTIQSTYYSL